MIFGFDIDGVLTNDDDGDTNIWLEHASEYFGEPMQKRSFYIEEAFNKTTEEVLEFFAAKLETIVSSVAIREHCAATLHDLWDRGHTIYLITARDEAHRQITKDWLNKHGVPYHSLYMSPRNESYCKGELSAEVGVNFFVDDKKENAEDVARHGIYTLLYHASHNLDHQTSLPIVKNWLEVQQHIKRFLQETLSPSSSRHIS